MKYKMLKKILGFFSEVLNKFSPELNVIALVSSPYIFQFAYFEIQLS